MGQSTARAHKQQIIDVHDHQGRTFLARVHVQEVYVLERAFEVQDVGHEVQQSELDQEWSVDKTVHCLQQFEKEEKPVVVLHRTEAQRTEMAPRVRPRSKPNLSKGTGLKSQLYGTLLNVLEAHSLQGSCRMIVGLKNPVQVLGRDGNAKSV